MISLDWDFLSCIATILVAAAMFAVSAAAIFGAHLFFKRIFK